MSVDSPDLSGSETRRGPGRPAGGRSGEGQEALLEAARALLEEKGLPRMTVREVAERAGVQPALVHYYFGGKDGLLREVVRRGAEQMLERISAAAARPGTVEERLRALVHAVVEQCVEAPYTPRLVVEQVLFGEDAAVEEFVEGYARRNRATLEELLREGAEAGALREVDPLFLIPSLLGGCIFFFLASPVVSRLFDLERITPELGERLAEHTVDVLLHGISARPRESS